MNGYSRLGKEGNSPVSTVTQTPSPPSSPRFRHRQNKNSGCGSRGPKLQKFGEWLAYIVLSALLRRRGILLFAPLIYMSGMLMYMGSLSLEIVPTAVVVDQPPSPGSTYRSPQDFEKLWPFMQADGNHSSNADMAAKKTIGLGHKKDGLYVLDSNPPIATFAIKMNVSSPTSDELFTCSFSIHRIFWLSCMYGV